MRYADLTFVLHGFLSAQEAVVMALPYADLPGGSGIHAGPGSPVVIERAEVTFPNGWRLSILRGLLSAGAPADYETARLGATEPHPVKHRTIESVQAELDAVASLPPLKSDRR